MEHEPFGELVQREDNQRERGDAAVRFMKNHSVQSPKSKVQSQANRDVEFKTLDFRLWTLDFVHGAGADFGGRL